ncbi:alpha/beta hydrolase [Rhodococcus sp. TAF43]|uniref:alpha/beta fold hydrolase n=1 Tax=unclassified Rhodococcus (in: high G+C Gram-positive bacteria) TaxID=192944 RepID=UPI000E0A19C6|nr:MULTISPECIES: alpha/beta hydrolase [unclassified Rhodococcus (in: high G+C Gram-positive bacteria)]QKT09677.1 alpha/beta hydrolase [Rhodococcus sp. W8901]RDI16950.1 pimeloyl-ACP methyl ester carboxylesterase [Rhodococcus sp. AG1013]
MYEKKSLIADGFHTTYIEAGNPDKDTIVLIHDGGFGSTAELCWSEMIPHLTDRFHVLAPDLLGWGGTDKAVFLDRPPFAPRVKHIAAFCQELGVDRAHFVGASFGGSMVMRAITDPTSPWPVDRAVSISGTGGPYRLPEGIAALADYTPSLEDAARMTGYMVRSLDGMDEHIRQRFENSLIPGHWEAMAAPRLSNPSVERTQIADPFLDLLAATQIPVLLVEGTRDELLESGWSKKLADLTPMARAAELDYAHEPNIDAPAETAGLIVDFLTGGLE